MVVASALAEPLRRFEAGVRFGVELGDARGQHAHAAIGRGASSARRHVKRVVAHRTADLGAASHDEQGLAQKAGHRVDVGLAVFISLTEADARFLCEAKQRKTEKECGNHEKQASAIGVF
jgi:hypothetical protein